MDFKKRFKEGLDGHYQGLDNGFNKINNYIFGQQKGCYVLLGGQSGTYKTTFTDFWVLNVLESADKSGIPLDLFYYSFEIDEQTKYANWLSSVIFKKYNEIIEPERIKGLGSLRCNLVQQDLINKEIDYVKHLTNKIKFRFEAINPTGIFHELWQQAEKDGEIQCEDYTIKDESGNIVPKKRIIGYKPHDPNKVTLSVLDHFAKLRSERGFALKENIDKMSDYSINLRNLFGQSFFYVQQFNQGISSVERVKFQGIDLTPQQSDFRDSTTPFADADVVLGLMNPSKLNLKECMGYKVTELGENLAILKIIKNRLSKDNIAFGLFVDPRKGSIIELPKPNEIDYSKYKL